MLDKARADGLTSDRQHTTDPDREQWAEDHAVLQDAIIADLYEAARDVPCERFGDPRVFGPARLHSIPQF